MIFDTNAHTAAPERHQCPHRCRQDAMPRT
jgi:hypothetical protein